MHKRCIRMVTNVQLPIGNEQVGPCQLHLITRKGSCGQNTQPYTVQRQHPAPTPNKGRPTCKAPGRHAQLKTHLEGSTRKSLQESGQMDSSIQTIHKSSIWNMNEQGTQTIQCGGSTQNLLRR